MAVTRWESFGITLLVLFLFLFKKHCSFLKEVNFILDEIVLHVVLYPKVAIPKMLYPS
jgi:hypothetical protein